MNNNIVLKNIFGSSARARIVKLFLHHPNLSINIEEISKRVGIKNKECAVVIKELSSLGLLLAVKQNYGKAKKKAKKQKKAKI